MKVKITKDAPSISRAHLNDFKPELGPRYDDVLLLVSELVTNSVRHSNGDDRTEEEVVVRVAKQGSVVRLEVSDPGPCFDEDADRGSGLGLRIVERIADRWGIDKEGRCTVWAEVSLA